MGAWILVVYIVGQPVTAYTVPGFMYELHCKRAGDALVAHAAGAKLPRHVYTCVEQPGGR